MTKRNSYLIRKHTTVALEGLGFMSPWRFLTIITLWPQCCARFSISPVTFPFNSAELNFQALQSSLLLIRLYSVIGSPGWN